MQKNKLIVTLLFAVLSIFMITACSDSSIESNSGGNSGGGGTVHPELEPEPEPDLNVVKEFYNFITREDKSGGIYYSLYAILYDGSLYAWGNNNNGQLGIGDEVDKNTPTKVNLPGKVIQLIAEIERDSYTSYITSSFYAITENGELYAWGSNYGQLGVGDEIDRNTPTKVNLPGKIKTLKTSDRLVYAILEDGSLYAWGRNKYGNLGVGDEVDRNTPTKVNLPGTIKELIIDRSSAYAILEDGSLYAWGYNPYGMLGVGDEIDRNTPTKVNLPGTIKELIIDRSSTYAILEDGSLYAWGGNDHGQLGVGDEVYRNTPTKVNLPSTIKELIIGWWSSVYAILEDGSLYAWGENEDGELGVGDGLDKNTPTKVKFPSKIKELIIGISSNYAILEDGSLYAWGKNYSGRLGVGDKVDRNKPTKVNLPGKIKELITDWSSAFAILEDGSLYAWGSNYIGQLGVGDDVNRNTPTKVKLPSKIKELIIDSPYDNGNISAYAILEDGSLYAWGSNNYGALGVGDYMERDTPTKVTGINGTIKEIFSSTSIYGENRYFLTEDGLLYVTGWEDLYYPVKIEFKEK